MRGSWPRYWEDVNEGDSIGHIVVGPWTIMSFFAWMSAAGMKSIRFPLPSGGGIYDPRINARTTLGPHADYDLGAGQSACRATMTWAWRENVWSRSFSPTGWVTTASSGNIPSNSAGLFATAILAGTGAR